MTPDDTLKALLGAATPKGRDIGFELAVAERIALRRFWMSLLALLPWVLVLGLLTLFLLPTMTLVIEQMAPVAADLGVIAGVGLTAGLAVLALARRFQHS